jgi:hypothetical protein
MGLKSLFLHSMLILAGRCKAWSSLVKLGPDDPHGLLHHDVGHFQPFLNHL